MIEIIKELNIEVSKPNVFQVIVAKQYDKDTRFIKATFVDNGDKIYIPSDVGAVVTINALRKDGEAKCFMGDVNDDGTVTVPLSSWMLELDGQVNCDISVTDSTKRKLTTTSFMVNVEAASYSGEDISDDDNYGILVDLIAECTEAIEGVREAAGVLYTPQALTEEQKAQARANIDAVSVTDMSNTKNALASVAQRALGSVQSDELFTTPKNLFNPITADPGEFVNQTNGAIEPASDQIVSDYIPVTGGQTYVASRFRKDTNIQAALAGPSFRYACYDADKVFIEGNIDVNPMTLPENAAFVRFSYYYTWNNQVQFEQGDTVTDYVPYGRDVHIKPEYIPKDAELTDAVDNLADRVEDLEKKGGEDGGLVTPEDTTFFVKSKNLFPATTNKGEFVNQTNGALNSLAGQIATDFIPVVGGQTYTASYFRNSSQTQYAHTTNFRYACYDENKTFIKGELQVNPFTTPENTAFVRYSFDVSQLSANQFELGDTPTAYEKGGTYLAPDYIRLGAEEFVLNLPEKLYGLVGEELNIYFDNLVDSHDTDYQFDVTCTVGMQMERCYRLTATTAGTYPITIKATNKNGGSVEKTATIYVADTTAGNGENTSVIVLGDSTTDDGRVISKLNENMSGDVMGVTTLGTRGNNPNCHEGRSGWKFYDYFTTATNNPFYNPDTKTFDADYYFDNSGVSIPEWFLINLGINDMFDMRTDDAADVQINTLNGYCDNMIASLKAAARDRDIKIGVCLTIPPNYSQDAFGKAYGCGQTRDRYKRNNALWVQNQIERYGGKEDENIYLVPIYTNLDTKYNMGLEEIQHNKRNTTNKYNSPIGNGGVHPSTSGYWQIADVYWFFLKNQA